MCQALRSQKEEEKGGVNSDDQNLKYESTFLLPFTLSVKQAYLEQLRVGE